MTKNISTARSAYKRNLEALVSAQSKAALQEAGSAGKSAMNAAAGTVNAQIDTGTLDGAAYAAQLAKGIAEIKAAQQKQLEEQLKQQAQAIKAQQKAAAKANAKAEKKQEQTKQSAQARQGVQDDENTAKGGKWTPWGEQSPVVGPVRSGNTKKPSEETAAADGTKEENKSLWQRVKAAEAKTLQEGVPAAGENLPEETAKIVSGKENAEKAAKEEKIARVKALNRSQAKARAESRAARETNAGLLNKSKLNDSEKAEIYTRVNTWAENPENKSLMTALKTAKTKNRVGDLLEAGYTSQQLDEANEMLELYQKMGMGQVLKERVGGTAKGTVKTVASAGMMGADTAMQTAENAVASVKDEEYRNAVKQYNDALLKTQTMEDSNTAYTLDENGNSVQTEEYQKAWQQLNDARAVMDRKDKEINAPVSKDTSGYKMYQSAQEDLARSDLGLDAGTKMLKGAATSAAENIAIAAVNPALVLPVLSAQGAAGGMANSIEKEAPAVNTLSNGMAKFMAGWAINSVGVEQMLDSMGASGARNTIAAQIVQSIKNNSKLAQTNPAFYAVLMGAGDNGLQSFAENWADRAIDLATNTAEPMSLQELAAQSLQEAASGALGGAMTAVAGLGVNAGRQAAYERAQTRQEAQTAAMQNETAVNDNPATHTEVQMNGIEKYKQSVDPDMVSFIENTRKGNYTTPYLVAETNDRMRSAMQALSGLGKVGDVTILDDNGVQHIDKRHGVNGEADKTMSKTEDMARAAYVLQSFDNAYLATDKAEGYRTARGKRAPIIIFDKKIDGTHIVVEAVSDSKKNRNYIVSEYLSKNGVDQTKIARVWQAPMDAGNTDPRDTSKTLAATPLAENSVSQTDISVNENPGESTVTDYNAKAVGATSDNTAIGRSNGKADVTGDIAALKDVLESGRNVTPDIGKMFVPNGSSEEMRLRKAENRKALAQILGVEENEIPTTLKAAREYLAKVDASKLVMRQAQESQSQEGQNGEMQSNAAAAGAAGERAGSEPVLRAVPMESVPEGMQQVAREISESTGARVEYFESDNPRALGAYENGTLSLNKNLNTKEAAQQTIVHEFTHWMEGTNTYSKMRQYITDSRILQEAARAATGLNEPPQGMNWAEAWQQKILEDYAAAGIEADAEKEMIAKLCEKYLFYNEDAVNKICRENMSLAETVLDWVREMISRVRGATMEAELRHIERLYRKGIAEAKSRTEQENGGTEYSFAGENAETANGDMLETAKQMRNAGADNEEIRQATGWFRGADGKWRFEIDDSGVKVKDDLHTYGTLKEVIDAPELFAAYPDAGNIFVSFENTNGKSGAYNPEFDSISLNAELKSDPEKLKSTLLHEMQHAIQNREGFASGANTKHWNQRLENGFDSRTAKAKAEEYQLQKQYERMRSENPEFVADMERLEEMTPNKPRGKVDWETLEKIEPDPPEWVKFDAERERLEQKYGEENVWDFQKLSYELKQSKSQGMRTAKDLYWDTAGEVEARDVQKRRGYTAEERRQNAPDLGNENTVFAERKNANSINPDFAKDVDSWDKNGRDQTESFVLGTTSDVLQGLGAKEADIFMRGDKISKILKDHPEITLKQIKKIPQVLENPLLILKSKKKSLTTAGFFYLAR